MRNIALFSPFAEGLMAALASRAYEWAYWEIEESFVAQIQGERSTVSNLNTILRTESRGGRALEISHSFADANESASSSSFLAVDRLLKGESPAQAATLKARAKTWQNSAPGLIQAFDAPPLLGPSGQPDPLPLTDVLAKKNVASAAISRLKNSLGFAQDSV